MLERLLYPMVNEGAKILDEGIAIRGSDIDVVWVNGYGWPLYRGGPMFWADSIGLAEIADKITDYSESLGGRHWELSPLLAVSPTRAASSRRTATDDVSDHRQRRPARTRSVRLPSDGHGGYEQPDGPAEPVAVADGHPSRRDI